MKNLKIALVAALFSFATLSFAGGFSDRPDRVQSISLEQAISNPDMVQAMHEQLDPDFLNGEQTVFYAVVTFAGKVYVVHGSSRAWKAFFMNTIKVLPKAIAYED